MTPCPQASILCVGLNPALDITYQLAHLARGEAQRVRSATTTAGGKAANVCRVLTTLGGLAHLIAPVGGTDGRKYAALLAADRVPHTAVPVKGSTRRTVVLVEDDGTTTLLNEPGPTGDLTDWQAIITAVNDLLLGGLPTGLPTDVPAGMTTTPVGALVLSGSVAPGLPNDAVAQLVRRGRAHGIPVIIDTSGAQLRAALEANPTVVKPNADELIEATGRPGLAGARELARAHPGTVVVASAGAEGLVVTDASGLVVTARPGRHLTGNPTGAGDAAVAAIALGLLKGDAWTDIARSAVATSGAAVLEPVAGVVDLARITELVRDVAVMGHAPEPFTPTIDQERS